MIAPNARCVVAGLALLLAGSGSTLAADAQAFGNRVKQAAADSSVSLNYASAESAGDNVILKAVTAGDGDGQVKLGDVAFEGVTGSDTDGWKVARVPFADIDTTEGDRQTQVRGMVLQGLQLAGEAAPSKLPGQSQFFFDSAAIQSARSSRNGKPFFTLGATTFRNEVAGNGKIDSDFALGDMMYDFAASGDDKTARTMTAIGYPQLTGSGSMRMSWEPKSGDFGVSPLTLRFQNAGTLDLSYLISGYTPAFAQSLNAIRKQMAADPQNAQSSGMAIIGLLSQLSVGSLKIAFADDSLTGKLLDYYSQQNGQSRAQLVESLSQMAPQMLASLNNPAFQQKVSSVVETYLKNPKSIEIAVAPEKPIPATQILGAAMGAPQTLPDVLQLRVTANGASAQ